MYYPFWGGANFQFFPCFELSYLAPENELLGLFIPKLLKIGAMVTFLRVFFCRAEYNEKQTESQASRRFEGLYWGAFLENDHYAQQNLLVILKPEVSAITFAPEH